jgi:ABC-2 type transport system permease protein
MLALIIRELKLYFITPVAYIFTAIFIVSTMSLTFYFGNFFSSGVAELSIFFSFIPWVFIFFIPAVTMKSWSEEKRLGTIELLLTLPIPLEGNW